MPGTTIFLIGFMGAGKTTFGKKLATKLRYAYMDLDDAICKKQQVQSIRELVDTKGMDLFRKVENEVLKSIPLGHAVISTGGGTPCYYDSLEWMRENGTVVYLDVNEGVLFSRLKTTDLEERPLLKGLDDDGLKEFIHTKLAERLPYYEQAHIRFDPSHQKMEELLVQLS